MKEIKVKGKVIEEVDETNRSILIKYLEHNGYELIRKYEMTAIDEDCKTYTVYCAELIEVGE